MLVRSGAVDVDLRRLGRGADAARRARGPDGRPDRRPAGADDEPGDAQARRQPQPHADALPLHQPDPREGRRHVRLAGDAAGRPRAEVLLVPAPGHPPHRDAQGGHRGGRQPRAREGRQEQGRRAVPPGRVRHRVRQGHLDRRLPDRPRHRAQRRRRSPARSSPTATSASARAATTPRRSSTSTSRSPRRSRPRSTTALGIDRDLVAPIDARAPTPSPTSSPPRARRAGAPSSRAAPRPTRTDAAAARARARPTATSATATARWPRCGATSSAKRRRGAGRSRRPSRSCERQGYLDDARYARASPRTAAARRVGRRAHRAAPARGRRRRRS